MTTGTEIIPGRLRDLLERPLFANLARAAARDPLDATSRGGTRGVLSGHRRGGGCPGATRWPAAGPSGLAVCSVGHCVAGSGVRWLTDRRWCVPPGPASAARAAAPIAAAERTKAVV
jgi:hypothetical protein